MPRYRLLPSDSGIQSPQPRRTSGLEWHIGRIIVRFVTRETQHLSDGELYYIIQNGLRLTGMPAWGVPGDEDGNEDSWKLVLFIRHLPNSTMEEEQQMEKLNPRSPEDSKKKKKKRSF